MPFFACENFTTVAEVAAHELCDLDPEDDLELITDAISAASDILYVLSGGRVTGICTTRKYPLRRVCAPDPDPWYAIYGVDVIPLADNLISVNEIKIDGVALALSDYGVIDHRYVFLRTRNWPGSNNLKLDDTEVGIWSILYTFGYQVDMLSRGAATEVALRLIEDDRGGGTFLRNIISANVQGASVALDQAAAAMARRGLPQLERFLGVYAPQGGFPSGVYDPALENGWVLADLGGPSGS